MAEYDKLTGGAGVDWEAVRQFAKAKMELKKLEREYSKLNNIVNQNSQYCDYTWKTKIGEVVAVKDLEDDHLKNIVSLLERTEGAYMSDAIADEYAERGFGYIGGERDYDNESKDEGYDF